MRWNGKIWDADREGSEEWIGSVHMFVWNTECMGFTMVILFGGLGCECDVIGSFMSSAIESIWMSFYWETWGSGKLVKWLVVLTCSLSLYFCSTPR